ncbi:MAG: arginine--tRNA ligase [Alphaproteobacteria bacterium]|nr:arginine--tRNA ligase [Alphaproteobacteria bacterium]
MSFFNIVSSKIEAIFIMYLKFEGVDFAQGEWLRRADRPDLGDIQCNEAMRLARVVNMKPLEFAVLLVKDLKELQINKLDIFEDVSIAGGGFINMKLSLPCMLSYFKENFVDNSIADMLVIPKEDRKRIIVDYGSPNIAKPLQVGNMRSVIIGEAILNMLTTLGHDVIPDNHIGDWGRPVGIIIAMLTEDEKYKCFLSQNIDDFKDCKIDFNKIPPLYIKGSQRIRDDKEFLEKVRCYTEKLQAREKGFMAIWEQLIYGTSKNLKKQFMDLGCPIIADAPLRGESYFQDSAIEIIEKIKSHYLVKKDEGAIIVDLKHKNLVPPILVNRDGALTYFATDLATLVQNDKDGFDIGLYVVDDRQSLHFEQLFTVAKILNLCPNGIKTRHIKFGTYNGIDGKPMKSRSGESLILEDFLTGTAYSPLDIRWLEMQNDHTKNVVFNPEELSIVDKSSILEWTALSVHKPVEELDDSSPREQKQLLIDMFYSLFVFRRYIESDSHQLILADLVVVTKSLQGYFDPTHGQDKLVNKAVELLQVGFKSLNLTE